MTCTVGLAKVGPNDPKRYNVTKLIGQGAFGRVYEAKDGETGDVVAIKKIDVDELENNELLIISEIVHPNVVRLLGHYQESRQDAPLFTDECLVLEYGGISLSEFIEVYRKQEQQLPPSMVRVLTFQLFRILNYLHAKKIIHRDIKPSNLLVNLGTNVLKICDFGSAKKMIPGQANSVGVCTQPYRAPEIELGSKEYDEKSDIWSAGCVVAECATGAVLFKPSDTVKHMDAIRALLGDPTAEEVAEVKLLKVPVLQPLRPPTFENRFGQLPSPLQQETIALLKQVLQYRPSHRPSAMELMASEFYVPLRKTQGYEKVLYDLFSEEILETPSALLERIVPPEFRNEVVKQRISGAGSLGTSVATPSVPSNVNPQR